MTVRAKLSAALLAVVLGLPIALAAQDVPLKVAGTDVPVPKRTKFVAPVYPPSAQAQGLRGIVILELVIDEQGKVATADVVRSVPPFDEAALVAVRQWEYEVTKVDGVPVRVRHTLPITFALKLPPMERQAGVPEMRQGVAPVVPPGTDRTALVSADVTLHRDGSVADAAVTAGDSPFAEALLQAVRTWRFAPEPDEASIVSFRVEAEFVPGRAGGAPGRVDLKLKDARRTAAAPDTQPTPAPAADAPPAEKAATPAPPEAGAAPATEGPSSTPTAPPSTPAPVPATSPTPIAPAPAAPAPAAPARPAPAPPAAGATPSTSATPPPVEVSAPRPGDGKPASVPAAAAPAGAATAAPPTAPVRNDPGFSAVRDVTLGPGVPDLAKGRRPIVPPLARMSAAAGVVELQLAVDAAGGVSVQNVTGPELLKEAARQAALSWSFRRTTADRLYLVATFTYSGDQARAEVRRAQ